MSNLYLSKYSSDKQTFHSSHTSARSLVDQMLDETVLNAIAYSIETKEFLKVDPIVTSENKIWVEPGMLLAINEGEIYVEVEGSYIKNSDGLYVLVKTTDEGESYLYFTGEIEDFRDLYLNEIDTPGAIDTLAFIDLEKEIVQPLEITFKGFQFQITPVGL